MMSVHSPSEADLCSVIPSSLRFSLPPCSLSTSTTARSTFIPSLRKTREVSSTLPPEVTTSSTTRQRLPATREPSTARCVCVCVCVYVCVCVVCVCVCVCVCWKGSISNLTPYALLGRTSTLPLSFDLSHLCSIGLCLLPTN